MQKETEPVTQSDLDEQTADRVELLEQQVNHDDVEYESKRAIDGKFNRYLLIIVALFVAMSVVGGVNLNRSLNPGAGDSVFELGEPEISGATELCSGDSLSFRIDATVSEAGVYRLAMATWRLDPKPATYAFSDGLDMVMAEPREFPIEIKWIVPATFYNLASGKDEPWPSGEFSRDISVTATGRNTNTTPRQVRFTIKESCGGEQ